MRTAAYARYSSDLQRDTSLDDQIHSCREYAARHEWTWQDTQVYTDAGISGASLDGRPGLAALLDLAYADNPPFDVILVDDSSRVSRDLADALRVVQRLTFAGVRVVYISQGVDSSNEQAETLIAVHGLVDSMYLKEMAAKIKRGLKGQIARGFATGSLTYGYRSQPSAETTRGEPHGYVPVIEPREAETIRAIFGWYGDGMSVPSILKRLTGPHPPPRGGQWRVGAVQRILRNPKYTGQLVWGRTQQSRRPGGRGRVVKHMPPAQWQTRVVPELRIISDELWDRVQARRRETDAYLNPQRQAGRGLLKGRNAKLFSTTLFSGFLTCGVCNHAFNTVANHLIKGVRYRYYGCAHANRGGDAICTNRLRVRMEVADRALLDGLRTELQSPEMLAYITEQLTAALNAAVDERPAHRATLEQARAASATKLTHLVSAVEAGAGTPTIFRAIHEREEELRTLDGQLAATETPLRERLAVIPSWVRQQLDDVARVVGWQADAARAEFRRLGVHFRLLPSGQTLRAEGTFQHTAALKHPFPVSTVFLHQHDGYRTFEVDLPTSGRLARKTA